VGSGGTWTDHLRGRARRRAGEEHLINRKLKLAMTRSTKTGRQVWLWIDEGGRQHATFYYRHGTLIARICGEEIVWA
jgi:hypothetical protein